MLLRLAMHFPVFRRRDDIALKTKESGEEGCHGRTLRILWIPGGLDFQGVCEKIPLPVSVGVLQFVRPVGGRSQELLHVLCTVSEQYRLGWPRGYTASKFNLSYTPCILGCSNSFDQTPCFRYAALLPVHVVDRYLIELLKLSMWLSKTVKSRTNEAMKMIVKYEEAL